MKKDYFSRGYKKLAVLFLTIIIFFSAIVNVDAKMLTITDVSEKFNELITELNSIVTGNIYSKVNSDDKTLDIYFKNDNNEPEEKLESYNYTDDYIEYDNRNTIINEDTSGENFIAFLNINYIINSIINLSGFENMTLGDNANPEEVKTEEFYNTYGLQMEAEPVDLPTENGNITGDFIRYFKLSFDSEKIARLVEDYGKSTIDPDEEAVVKLKPTLEAKEITENSVVLYSSIDYTPINPDFTPFCYIYRSTSEEGTYEKISDFATNCSKDIGTIDEGLESNKTYYYKAIVVNGSEYSDVIKVTTKKAVVQPTGNNNEEIENPSTGIFLPSILLLIMTIISVVIINRVQKKLKIKKI